MKSRHSLILVITILVFTLVLSACAPAPSAEALRQTAVAETLTAMPPDATSEPSQISTAIPPTPTEKSTPVPIPTVGPSGPSDFPKDVNPLTGLIVEDPELLNRRPVLVKVANFPASGRPHAGLSFADIVFEYYIGEGINRFIGLYYGQDAPQIGPVRSGRLVDPQLTLMYEGILGFKGADSRVYSEITSLLGNRAITGTENTCPAICDNGDNTVTSIFADSDALSQLAGARGVDNSRPILDGMRFDPAAPANGVEANHVNVIFNILDRGEWVYDPDSGKYLRWIEEADVAQNVTMIPLVDRLTDEQLAFSNVIILFAYYTEYAPTLHDIGIWDNRTSQRAVIFRDGQAYDVYWRTVDTDAPIQFLDQNGEIFPLKPGNTWMVLMSMISSAVQTEDVWDFNFYLQ